MHEEIVKTLPTAVAVIEYARVNGFDTAGSDTLLALWNNEQKVQEVIPVEDTSTEE
jgi:hypothetical protein